MDRETACPCCSCAPCSRRLDDLHGWRCSVCTAGGFSGFAVCTAGTSRPPCADAGLEDGEPWGGGDARGEACALDVDPPSLARRGAEIAGVPRSGRLQPDSEGCL